MGDSGLIAGGLVFRGAAGVMAVDVLGKRRATQSRLRPPGAGSMKTSGVVVGVVAVLPRSVGRGPDRADRPQRRPKAQPCDEDNESWRSPRRRQTSGQG